MDNLASQGLPWCDTLLETLCDLESAREQKAILLKMQTLALNKEDIVSLRKVFSEQIQRFHLPLNGFSAKPEGRRVVLPVQKTFTDEIDEKMGGF